MPLRARPRLRLLAVALCAASASTYDDSDDLAFPTIRARAATAAGTTACVELGGQVRVDNWSHRSVDVTFGVKFD